MIKIGKGLPGRKSGGGNGAPAPATIVEVAAGRPKINERMNDLEKELEVCQDKFDTLNYEHKILLAEINIITDWIQDQFGVQLINKESQIFKYSNMSNGINDISRSLYMPKSSQTTSVRLQTGLSSQSQQLRNIIGKNFNQIQSYHNSVFSNEMDSVTISLQPPRRAVPQSYIPNYEVDHNNQLRDMSSGAYLQPQRKRQANLQFRNQQGFNNNTVLYPSGLIHPRVTYPPKRKRNNFLAIRKVPPSKTTRDEKVPELETTETALVKAEPSIHNNIEEIDTAPAEIATATKDTPATDAPAVTEPAAVEDNVEMQDQTELDTPKDTAEKALPADNNDDLDVPDFNNAEVKTEPAVDESAKAAAVDSAGDDGVEPKRKDKTIKHESKVQTIDAAGTSSEKPMMVGRRARKVPSRYRDEDETPTTPSKTKTTPTTRVAPTAPSKTKTPPTTKVATSGQGITPPQTTPTTTSSKKRFTCVWPKCGKSFVMKQQLTKHLQYHKSIHNKQSVLTLTKTTRVVTTTTNNKQGVGTLGNNNIKQPVSSMAKESNSANDNKQPVPGTNITINKQQPNSGSDKAEVNDDNKPSTTGTNPTTPNGFELEKLKCSYCQKVFSNPWNLKTHYRVHTGEKPYPCNYCGQRFAYNQSRELHERHNHTFERPYGCKYCGRAFYAASELNTHLIKKHGKTHVEHSLYEGPLMFPPDFADLPGNNATDMPYDGYDEDGDDDYSMGLEQQYLMLNNQEQPGGGRASEIVDGLMGSHFLFS